jgi:hypothetical protein
LEHNRWLGFAGSLLANNHQDKRDTLVGTILFQTISLKFKSSTSISSLCDRKLHLLYHVPNEIPSISTCQTHSTFNLYMILVEKIIVYTVKINNTIYSMMKGVNQPILLEVLVISYHRNLFANDNMYIYIGFMWCFPHLDDSLEGLDIEFTFYEIRMTFNKIGSFKTPNLLNFQWISYQIRLHKKTAIKLDKSLMKWDKSFRVKKSYQISNYWCNSILNTQTLFLELCEIQMRGNFL